MSVSAENGYELSFILPAFNEEECIEAAVIEALAALKKYTRRFELIVVDDGSRDGTKEILYRLVSTTPELKVIRHETNAGYGAALRTGFNAAQYPLVFYTDSDCQFDAGELGNFLPLSKEYDIVIGYRKRRRDNPLRIALSRGFNILTGAMIGLHVKDINCSFKLFRIEAIRKIEIESDEFFVDAEILAKTTAIGFKIHEKGVEHYPRRAGSPTIKPGNIPRTIKEMLRIRRSIKKLRGG